MKTGTRIAHSNHDILVLDIQIHRYLSTGGRIGQRVVQIVGDGLLNSLTVQQHDRVAAGDKQLQLKTAFLRRCGVKVAHLSDEFRYRDHLQMELHGTRISCADAEDGMNEACGAIHLLE